MVFSAPAGSSLGPFLYSDLGACSGLTGVAEGSADALELPQELLQAVFIGGKAWALQFALGGSNFALSMPLNGSPVGVEFRSYCFH